MIFEILTIFPNFFDCFLKESLIKRAREKGLVKICIHNLRDFTDDPHQVVDDKAFGGGIGMVLKLEPIFKAVSSLSKSEIRWTRSGLPGGLHPKSETKSKIQNLKSKTILFTPRGKKFNQKMASEWVKMDQLILICGRYEGIDERVAKYVADENISIGNFVMLGGEIAAMAVIETISRLIPGVIGKPQLLKERVAERKGFIEFPQFTRPEVFSPKKGMAWKVPKVLLSGHHKKIEEWRKKHSKIIK